ncbi:MAG: helix-hairpin-helix domain-containing protein [Leptolyngbya sp. RL_3_1]|nr:helix-hairpin-helix domain-containing protein [Leptolyngbya sp. RL_3_1]
MAAALGVRIDVNRATVDDWLRLPGLSIHQAHRLVHRVEQGGGAVVPRGYRRSVRSVGSRARALSTDSPILLLRGRSQRQSRESLPLGICA